MTVLARRGLGLALAALAMGAQEPATIGAAAMQPDGTVILDLRAGVGPGGLVGDARFAYPPSHPENQAIPCYPGGLRPGETKPVRPFP